MKKRGISPLIATVLLIGITVMISIIVFNFVKTTMEDQTTETETHSDILLACSQTLRLEYDDPMPCGSGNDLNVTVWNKSPLDITDFKIQVLSSSNSEFYEGGELTSYNKTLYSVSSMVFSVSDVVKINLIPTIKLEDINGTCGAISFEVTSLGIC